ncbi:MAG: HpcH/HpaI aldolase/citrate lyase family protein [Rhodobacteraceae bacterium]|nr:HpcH/HpaI aldolase/citrate lyase family protein [Paracoccaceae bacterium]
MSELPPNALKAALAAGQGQIGLWCSLPDPYVVEGLAGAGFDWLMFDTEHAPADPVTVLPLLQAAAGHGASIVVRPASNDPVVIKRLLDLGVQTLLIPYVQSAEEARQAVAAMRYPPTGVRGVAGLTRATDFGRVADYQKIAHQELCCLVQVETRESLDAIENIAKVDGVDGIFIGPGDLAASLGYPGEIMNPAVQGAIEDAVKRINAAGKPAGILATNDEYAKRCLEMGTRFTAVGSDLTLLIRGADSLARTFKPPATANAM